MVDAPVEKLGLFALRAEDFPEVGSEYEADLDGHAARWQVTDVVDLGGFVDGVRQVEVYGKRIA